VNTATATSPASVAVIRRTADPRPTTRAQSGVPGRVTYRDGEIGPSSTPPGGEAGGEPLEFELLDPTSAPVALYRRYGRGQQQHDAHRIAPRGRLVEKGAKVALARPGGLSSATPSDGSRRPGASLTYGKAPKGSTFWAATSTLVCRDGCWNAASAATTCTAGPYNGR
jgi:hypothetical protein